ncbi:MAG: tRNA (guanosine(37)-N1)-methyltransferase TrmD [Candidatus Tectomicrobia bacterium]|uniref:tRNA (guanine-N(1)-)-methyltransferase n=1 Tax=Tectimicrobiota bacterium TaxID=2528274 RepID=A0A932LZL8_UNCTE|nr:tRNA (guanosine(37)-N1)-methyltransferase TrmD [Candidatus Tectomicrobia bacterium]
MWIDVLTLFPEILQSPLNASLLRKAQERGAVRFAIHNLRDYALDRHRTTDDSPFGGGAGMVLKPEPIARALEAVRAPGTRLPGAPRVPEGERGRVILLCPQGRQLNQKIVRELAAESRLILVCGHYEGVDERIRLHYVDDEISIGDYILTGGELPALVLLDAVVRLLPGALGNPCSAADESFGGGGLDYPHYTRPRKFGDKRVPDVLLSGDHREIARWRRKEALRRTREKRPDLLDPGALTPEDRTILEEIEREDLLRTSSPDGRAVEPSAARQK